MFNARLSLEEDGLYLDPWTLDSFEENGELCCPNCGAWCHVENLAATGYCGRCNEEGD